MDPLLAALGVAALLVGATGTWSPCGFSMIETIGPTGHVGGMPTTLAACATFAPFAVLGGLVTFCALAAIGGLLHGAAGMLAYAVAALIALAAALAEARGVPIVPQVRRQLPVDWRRSMPMPLAAAGYGVLLGLGFTTFVLSYGVWALMGVSLALGDLGAGLVIGLAFGIGRALPIVVLAPLADRRSGERACEAMAMRPALYRGARAGDAVALTAVAALLVSTGVSDASRREVARASDPSVAGPALVYELRSGGGEMRTNGHRTPLPGSDPATGGPYVAVIRSGGISILDRATLTELGRVNAGSADALAIARDWLVYRSRSNGTDTLRAVSVGDPTDPGAPFQIARARGPSQLSAPGLDRRLVVYALDKRGRSKLIRAKLRPHGPSGKQALLSSRSELYTAPSVAGKAIAFVATTRGHQTVRVKGLGPDRGHVVERAGHAPPTLWNTAIAGNRVYYTVVKQGGTGKLLSVGR